MRYQVNVNIIHRWLREHEQQGLHSKPAFVPLALDPPRLPPMHVQAVVVNQNQQTSSSSDSVDASQILVEVSRGHHMVSIRWPVQAATSCSAWLSEWLK